MTPPLEHNYIGLSSEVSSNGSSSTVSSEDSDKVGSLKETELRLGLPGSQSPDRTNGPGLTLGIAPNRFASGSKRGFSDAIDGSGDWVFSGGTGSKEELGKGGALFSPKGGESAGAAKNLGLVGGVKDEEKKVLASSAPAAKAQVVGWPPIRSYRKNTMAANSPKNKEDAEGKQGLGLYVKVSMDGAPYLRKVDLKTYSNYKELSLALEKMFSCFTIGQCGSHGASTRDGLSESRLTDLIHGSEYVLTYEDKDGDWMLVGDVPWDMFTDSCRRLRIMKGSDAIGLAPRAVEKSKNRK